MTTFAVELRPIPPPRAYQDHIEKVVRAVLRKAIFDPVLETMSMAGETIANSRSALLAAIRRGRIRYVDGGFMGFFSAAISVELRALGAYWDHKSGSYRLSKEDITPDVTEALTLADMAFVKRIERADALLAALDPVKISGNARLAPLLDAALWKIDGDLSKSVKRISVLPELTPDQRKRIAAEWELNLQRSIKDFAVQEISKLRQDIQKSVFAGNRFETMERAIKRNYGVTQSKARFLARQETNLLMAKFKETRYAAAGVHEYKWRCVAGSKDHPVRPSHKILDGKIFRFDSPPVTTAPDEPQRRNNPGEDFNCFPGSTPVAHLRGVRKLYRRRFPGPLAFVIADNGARIDATPNHPVLTDSGWKALKDIDVGDRLVEAGLKSIDATKVDVENAQPTIEQIFGLGFIVGEVINAAGHTTQFHGDGAAEEVNVVSVECGLMPEIDGISAKKLGECLLAVANEVIVGLTLAEQGELSATVVAGGLPPDGAVGRIGQLLALIVGKSGHAKDVRLGAAANLHAALKKTSANDRAANAIVFGESQFTTASDICFDDVFCRKMFAVLCRASDGAESIESACSEILAHDVRRAAELSADVRERHPALKEFRRVVDKGLGVGLGHYVYNLETDGHWYLARGFAVHNCRCQAVPLARFRKDA